MGNLRGDSEAEIESLTKLHDGVPCKAPATPQTKSLEKVGLATETRNHVRKSARSIGFNSRILGISKLICPQCAIEALVEPEVNIICGNCSVRMQVG